MSFDGTQRDDEGMKAGLVRLHERLVAHSAALLESRISAVDDMAGVLRTLVSRGRGDDVLRRVVKRFGLSEPHVQVSPPVVRSKGIQLAFGGLPKRSGGDNISVFEWSESLALSKAGLRRDYYTWAQFVTEFANTEGSHLSGTIPSVLSAAKVHAVSEMDLSTYLVWSAGEVVAVATEQALQSLELPATGTFKGPGVRVNRLLIHDDPEKRLGLVDVEPIATASAVGEEGTGALITVRGIHLTRPDLAYQMYARRVRVSDTGDEQYEMAVGWVDPNDANVSPPWSAR